VEHQGEQEDPLACFDDELRDDGRAVEEETVLELEPAADAQCEGDITLLFDRERKGADDFARWQSGRRQLNDLQMGLLNESLLESEPVTASQQLEATYDGPLLPPLPPVFGASSHAKEVYEEACIARDAAPPPASETKPALVLDSSQPWRQNLKLMRAAEADEMDWEQELSAKFDETPIQFRDAEENLLTLQQSLVEEIQDRRDVGMELNTAIDSLRETGSEAVATESSEMEESFLQHTLLAEESFHQIQATIMEANWNQLCEYDEHMFEHLLENGAYDIETKMEEERERRDAGLSAFEAKTKEKYKELTSQLLESRRERSKVEDMMLTFMDKLVLGPHFAAEYLGERTEGCGV